jgi:ElaB/YqjD/DUF883 family membrane-anchored ribosome-binding protein
MQSLLDSTSAAGSEVLSEAKSLGETAVDRVHSELDSRKGDAAAQVKSVSSAIGSAADQLDPAAPQWLKSALEQGASQIQAFAATLEQNDSRELANSVGEFARRAPFTFLAACAAVGFGTARVLKAGSATASQKQKETHLEDDMSAAQPSYRPQYEQSAGVSDGRAL